MAQLTRAAILALILGLGAATGAGATCLRYEPAQVVLVGRLATDGRFLALKLDHPICVVAGAGQPAAEGVRLVRFTLQMLRGASGVAGWAGRRAVVSGSLYRGPHDREGQLSLLVTGFGRAR